MKPGTFIKLPDGREGTVVYHGLDGYGIQWGRKAVDLQAIMSRNPLFDNGSDDPNPYGPEAMLRKPYLSADLECVGEEYEIIS